MRGLDLAANFEERRKVVDTQLAAQGRSFGLKMKVGSVFASQAILPAYELRAPGTRLFELEGNQYRLVEYRFWKDPLFLYCPPSHYRVPVEEVVRLYADHYFLPLKQDEKGHVTQFALPIKVGMIPTWMTLPVRECFGRKGGRIDVLGLTMDIVEWYPVSGGQSHNGSTIPPFAVAVEQTLRET